MRRGGTVPRVANLTSQSFFWLHQFASRPVVLTAAADAWPALERWDLSYFEERLGEVPVNLWSSSSRIFPFDPARPEPRRQHEVAALAEYLDYLAQPLHRPPHYYLAQTPLAGAFAPLLTDVKEPSAIAGRGAAAANIWLAPALTRSVLHCDEHDNFLTQVCGQKTVTLYHPLEIGKLSPLPIEGKFPHFSPIDVAAADFATHPQFFAARPIICTLEPGQTLFIPRGWWHQVTSGSSWTASVTYWWLPRRRDRVSPAGLFELPMQHRRARWRAWLKRKGA